MHYTALYCIAHYRIAEGNRVQCTVVHTYLSRPGFVLLSIKPRFLQWVSNMEAKHSL